jgi:hypothetical protein
MSSVASLAHRVTVGRGHPRHHLGEPVGLVRAVIDSPDRSAAASSSASAAAGSGPGAWVGSARPAVAGGHRWRTGRAGTSMAAVADVTRRSLRGSSPKLIGPPGAASPEPKPTPAVARRAPRRRRHLKPRSHGCSVVRLYNEQRLHRGRNMPGRTPVQACCRGQRKPTTTAPSKRQLGQPPTAASTSPEER